MAYPGDGDVARALRAVGAAQPEGWAPVVAAACRAHGIDAPRRLAMFVANVAHETGGLRTLVENLNYSVDGLLKTFGRHRIGEVDARRLGRKPGEGPLPEARQRAIANLVYGGEWGRKNLGNTGPDDGWTFRGAGLIQTTGRRNYERLAEAIGAYVGALPALLQTREGAAESAAHFWRARRISDRADLGDVEGCRRLVNGGILGLAEVEGGYRAALAALQAPVRK